MIDVIIGINLFRANLPEIKFEIKIVIFRALNYKMKIPLINCHKNYNAKETLSKLNSLFL